MAVAARWPDRAALQIFQDGVCKTHTYRDLVAHFEAGAETLRQAGLRAGDRVVLLAENRPEWITACLSALSAGATVAPLDPALSPADLRRQIDRAGPRALLLSTRMLETFRTDIPRGIAVLDIENRLDPFEGYPHRTESGPSDDATSNAALLIFTSGTSGEPKGILLGHAGLLYTASACLSALELEERDTAYRTVSIVPLHHVTGFTLNCLAPLLEAVITTFVDPVNAENILATMQEAQPDMLVGVPRLYELFYSEIRRNVSAKGPLADGVFRALGWLCACIRRLTPWNPGPRFFGPVHSAFGGALRICCTGAAPLPVEVQKSLERLGFTVMEAYGLTESSGVATVSPRSQRRLGTVGRPHPGVQVRIANPDAASGDGEICIRGPIVMQGYFQDEKATAEAIRDGWLHTGDLGRFDHDGNLIITGRIKELIVTPGGKNVSPVDVELRYRELPGVKELAVFGMPVAEGYGEEVHAAVVPDTEAFDASEDDLQQIIELAVNARAPEIPGHLRIQRVHLVEALPKTTTIKVKRQELPGLVLLHRDTDDTGRAADPAPEASEATDEIAQEVLRIVGEVIREAGDIQKIRLNSVLQFELGIDSLGLIELSARLERRFGVRLDEDRLPALHKVGDLLRAVREALAKGRVAPEGGAPATDIMSEGRTESVPPPRGMFRRALLSLFGSISRLLWRFEASGVENVPDTGAFLLCPNHESHLDIFWVAAWLPASARRQLCCFAKREHFDASFTRCIAGLAGAIPTDRDRDVLPALRAGVKALKTGRPLFIHPEGTRTRTGALGPFRRGAALLALAANVPLIPVRIAGAYEIFPPHRLLPRVFDWRRGRRRKLQIVFAPPILPKSNGCEALDEAQLTQHLRQTVEALGVQTQENG